MRFVSTETGGYRIFAVTGTNTISFAVDFANADTTGLLGFAVERADPAEDENYFMYGMKVFESVIRHPGPDMIVSTFDHPIQSFVWDDFTAKPDRQYEYRFHPLRGKPKSIDRSAPPIGIRVRTEPLFSANEHDIFFNRGVASSQAYARRFDNQAPDRIADPDLRAEALAWLSRDLDEALLKFIDGAKRGDTLLGCFYEFRYPEVARRLAAAASRGVAVALILDSKVNERTDKEGKFHESFPREENRRLVADVGLPASTIALWREHNPNDIQHNKFMVRLKGKRKRPVEVWTGSTNLSFGGIHGQTNVGHWVRNEGVAAAFKAYWDILAADPGSADGDTRSAALAKRKAYRQAVEALSPAPPAWANIPAGVTAIFSPRIGTSVLDLYATMLDQSVSLGAVTLAFGVSKPFKTALADNDAESPVTFLLLEKEDVPNPRASAPFVPLRASNNVYQAWGAYLRDPLYQWTRETNTGALGLNSHVRYIHSKFLLHDPLGADPIVVTGSANFSEPSTTGNDENMLLIRGDRRAADIYFTEFNRLFFHYYFRSVQEAIARGRRSAGTANAAADRSASLFLDETDGWLRKYERGKLRWKRVEMFTAMAGTATI